MLKKILITASFILVTLTSFSQTKDLAIAKIPELTLSHRSDQVAVYPNPANSEISISNKSGLILKLTVFNILGDELITQKITNGLTDINVSNLPAGTYIVAFADEQKVTTQRLIIG
ncbi:T9SS type A sorting domain-containing protein [Dokdonia sp. Hel_I_53]|uniref:T9SS type A sorting domain-containing protein n=1 Tax=Dokdonia sp. Hel_I_53 TaxID=1566287 RepID=UPI00119C8485|nr:T9SS type A sorting domain-containing protein [Dokdonia sp. Hel_I_53]TVZ51020.1 putative secreted protein (Por secretion system target) [Dokdonia sp. Hel_I_53]